MIFIYLIILLLLLWLIIGAAMILIKIILALYEFYTDLKQITKKRRG